MSRFSKLEMGGGHEELSPGAEVVKDGTFYMAEAKAAFERGRFEPALRAYARVLEHDPHDAGAWAGQARMLVELGEFREARVWADKALEQFPREPDLLAAKAAALARLGELDDALALSDSAVEERGGTPYVWLARGDVLLARREKLAEYSFEKAFQLAPTDWVVAWLASRIHLWHRKFSIALKHAQRAMTLNAAHAPVWLQMGHCQLAIGLPDLAAHSFAQARELDPHGTGAEKGLIAATRVGFLDRLRGQWAQLFRR